MLGTRRCSVTVAAGMLRLRVLPDYAARQIKEWQDDSE
jgi:hypothetical protein